MIIQRHQPVRALANESVRRRTFAWACVAVLLLVGSATADEAEDRAVALVEKLGGTVEYYAKKPGKPVKSIILRNKDCTDEDLKILAACKQLDYLNLDNTKVTDAGLKELAPLKQLYGLDLMNLTLTDAGMKELTKLKKLKSLSLTFRLGWNSMSPGVRALCRALPGLTINLDRKVGRE